MDALPSPRFEVFDDLERDEPAQASAVYGKNTEHTADNRELDSHTPLNEGEQLLRQGTSGFRKLGLYPSI